MAPAGIRVLIVDDDPDQAEGLSVLLQGEGYATAVTTEGRAAVRLAEAFVPHVALIDVGMPEVDGYEVVRQLRRLPSCQAARLVALTGFCMSEDREGALAEGFHHFVTKPVDVDALCHLLRDIVAGDHGAGLGSR